MGEGIRGTLQQSQWWGERGAAGSVDTKHAGELAEVSCESYA